MYLLTLLIIMEYFTIFLCLVQQISLFSRSFESFFIEILTEFEIVIPEMVENRMMSKGTPFGTDNNPREKYIIKNERKHMVLIMRNG